MKFLYKNIFTCIVIMLCLCTTVLAETNIYELNGVSTRLPVANLYIEGNLYTGNSGVRPLIIDNRMYIAATDLGHITNANVGWDAATESVIINSSAGSISYFKGGASYILNGKSYSLGGNTKFYVVNKKSMIPVSILPTFSDVGVSYDGNTNSTTITKGASHGDLFGDIDESENSNTPSTPVEPPSENVTPNLPMITPVDKCSTVIKTLDNKEILNINADKFVEVDTLYLQNPSRVAIDIKNYKATIFDGADTSNSKFIASINNYFHADTGKYRITLNLKEGVSTSNVKVENTANGINVIYNVPAKTFKYTSDRVNSELSLVLDKAVAVSEPSSLNGNKMILTIPKNNVVMNEGNVEYNDRIISSINTVTVDNNYVSTIVLKDRVSFSMTSNGISGTIILKFTKNNNSVPTIVIDAGHGGKDPGAINSGMGLNEKTLNLTATISLAEKLRSQGYNVIETRNSDVFVELKERANIANLKDADLFISVHHNSGSSTASGIETLYYPSADNKAIASIIQKDLISSTSALDRKIQSRPNLVVLNSTKMPAVLLELGFLSNSTEASKLANYEYVNTLTDAVVRSVNEYFGR